MIFGGYVMVDWSAKGEPSPRNESENAIWTACRGLKGRCKKPKYHRTRADVYEYLTDIMDEFKGSKKPILFSFDFPFGYPADAYKGFGCKDWKALWALIHGEIKDDIDGQRNKNNRFCVGGKLNNTCFGNLFENNDPHHGPFWGHPNPNDKRFTGLPFNTQEGYDTHLLAGEKLPSRLRKIEEMTAGAKSVWQLNGAGCVGSQVLMGLPYMYKLYKRGDVAVWPFEDIDEKNKSFVLAEIYPSIWHPENCHPIKDARQVYTVAKNIALFDKSGILHDLLKAPRDYDKKLAEKEGWMLGVDKKGNVIQCP